MALFDMSALVVISPAMTTRSVVTSVSQATRLVGSALRQWSSTASLIWSATLSGCPIDTDSLVNKYRSVLTSFPSIDKGVVTATIRNGAGLIERRRRLMQQEPWSVV